MSFTANCDVFAALHEDGFNRVVEHLRLQRPSLFNYATALFADLTSELCRPIPFHPIVPVRHNPLVTVVDPLPIPGANYGVNFSMQLAKIALDFHPFNVIALPPELRPPVPQRFGLQLSVCCGFGCPPKEIVDRLIPPPDPPGEKKPRDRDIEPIPTRKLLCFCLDAFAVGGVRIATYHGRPYLEPFLDGLEIVDLRPLELENSIECYLQLVLKLSVLPKMRVLLEHAPLELMKNVLSVVLKPMPASQAIPNNPAIEDDQLKAFIKVEVA